MLKVLGSDTVWAIGFLDNSNSQQEVGYLTLFRAGEGEGGEERGVHYTIVGSLTATPPHTDIGKVAIFTFLLEQVCFLMNSDMQSVITESML